MDRFIASAVTKYTVLMIEMRTSSSSFFIDDKFPVWFQA